MWYILWSFAGCRNVKPQRTFKHMVSMRVRCRVLIATGPLQGPSVLLYRQGTFRGCCDDPSGVFRAWALINIVSSSWCFLASRTFADPETVPVLRLDLHNQYSVCQLRLRAAMCGILACLLDGGGVCGYTAMNTKHAAGGQLAKHNAAGRSAGSLCALQNTAISP